MVFWIGAEEFRLYLPLPASLKDRRHIVRSLTDGARAKFNISVSDLGPKDSHREALLGFTASGSSSSEIEERLDMLEKFIEQRESDGDFEIFEITREVFTYGDLSD